MFSRSKKTYVLFVVFSTLLGMCLYKLWNIDKSFALRAVRNLEIASKLRNLEIASKPTRSSANAAIKGNSSERLFERAANCLKAAKRDISTYLTHASNHAEAGQSETKLEPKCTNDIFFVILVTSRPGNFANRAAIRLSWGRMDSDVNKQAIKSRTSLTWKTIFSVGLANSAKIGSVVSLEYDRFGDILRLPYQDSYKNLPNKTMNSLEWIADSCRPKYVLKTDDDCYINIFQMLTWLQSLPPSHEYIGRVNTEMPVIRDPKHRNFVAKEEHKENIYKPYCAGGGYVLKGSVIKKITEVGKKIKQIINEDAYMGMLANALHIVPRNEERFLPFIFFGPPVKKLNMCDWKDKFLVHNILGKRQLVMHFNSIAMEFHDSLCETL